MNVRYTLGIVSLALTLSACAGAGNSLAPLWNDDAAELNATKGGTTVEVPCEVVAALSGGSSDPTADCKIVWRTFQDKEQVTVTIKLDEHKSVTYDASGVSSSKVVALIAELEAKLGENQSEAVQAVTPEVVGAVKAAFGLP